MQAEVPKELLDAASVEGLLDGGAVAEAVLGGGERSARRSIKTFAETTGTKIENSLVQADAGDVVAKIDAEVKGGVARDLAFMTDSRFIAQFHAWATWRT